MPAEPKVGDKITLTGTITGIAPGSHATVDLDLGPTIGVPIANLQKQMTAGKTASTNKQQTKKKK